MSLCSLSILFSRLQRSWAGMVHLTWGVAPGCYSSRRWRCDQGDSDLTTCEPSEVSQTERGQATLPNHEVISLRGSYQLERSVDSYCPRSPRFQLTRNRLCNSLAVLI